jgi:diguanylate cyclase (GGDEF)-like protein
MTTDRDTAPERELPGEPGAREAADAAAPNPVPVVSVVPAPVGWSDPITGTDGPRLWDRIVLAESARVRRYKRPATVVLVEIAGLERLARQWGPDVGERTLVIAARVLSREIRESDHIARIEPVRFGIVLTETTEIEAINFVERARAACERELRVAREVVAVGFGWASPLAKRGLADALPIAEQRLAAELRSI